MKIIRILFLLSSFTFVINTNAQQANYFQQEVNTNIKVRLDDVQHFLHGAISMDYTNNSQDTLSFIYFHIYPNAYESDRTAYVRQAVENGNRKHYEAKKSDWGFIDSLNFSVEGNTAKFLPTEHLDIIKLLLNEPLLPGGQVNITTPFRVKIPLVFSRLGHSGQTYQISQWFPKPSVYDKNGWHPIPYLDQGEFYSEFGSYDVEITLPQNYLVMATGNLENAEEQRWMDDLAAKELSDSTFVTKQKNASSTHLKTLRFTETNVHDFAWFASKDWVLRKTEITVPETGNKVEGYVAFFPKNAKLYTTATEALKTTIEKYSKMVGPYPYKTVKVVDGFLEAGGGMEYPTVTVLTPMATALLTEKVIIHEVGHNWFYGILGSNERRFPWMDEGINSYYEQRVVDRDGQVQGKTQKFLRNINDNAFFITNAIRKSQPLNLPSIDYTQLNYGGDIYTKTPAYLRWLAAFMGQNDFDRAMQAYYSTWKFKHPQPEHFEAIFRSNSNKDISWFFSDGLQSATPVDYAIAAVNRRENGAIVVVKNKTGFNGPVALQVDSSSKIYWSNPFTNETKVEITEPFKIVRIADFVPDFNRVNNANKNGFRIKPFIGLGSEKSPTMYVLPALGYNVYDRFMLGVVLHNVSLHERRFQYILAPMYAFGSKTLVGTGVLSYAFYPQGKFIDEIHANLEGKRFSFDRSNTNIDKMLCIQYNKIAPELRFFLTKPHPRSSLNQYFSLKGYWIQEGQLNYYRDPVDSLFRPEIGKPINQIYGKVQYVVNNKRTYNPFDVTFEMQTGKSFSKLSAEGNIKIDYFKNKKGIYLRGYVGKMWEFNDNNFHRYDIASTYTGWNDYLYDGIFFGRNMQSGFAAQQISIKEGGMKMPTLFYSNQIGLSNDWLAALNVNIDLPIGLPIQLFADFTTFADAGKINPNGSKVLYDAGLKIHLAKFVEVNVPVLMSREYTEYRKSILGKNAFWKSITFNINLDQVYWSRLQRSLIR